MIVIGLCGRAGAGKNAVATALVRRHGFSEMAFADPIYSGLSAMCGIPVETLKNRATKELPIPWFGGVSPRRALQTLGTEWGRQMIADDLWVRLALRRLDELRESGSPGAVVTDVRFDNEASALREWATGMAQVWQVCRQSAPIIEAGAAAHSSEAGISATAIDAVIHNDGTLQTLAEEVSRLLGRQYRAIGGCCRV
jgi:hypothetical protein